MKTLVMLALGAVVVAQGVSPADAEAREFYHCRYAPGASYDGLIAAYELYRGLMDKNGYSDYKVELLFPLYDDQTEPGTFVWQGTSPSMARLGEANDWFWFSDAAAPSRAAFEKAAVCASASMFYTQKLD